MGKQTGRETLCVGTWIIQCVSERDKYRLVPRFDENSRPERLVRDSRGWNRQISRSQLVGAAKVAKHRCASISWQASERRSLETVHMRRYP